MEYNFIILIISLLLSLLAQFYITSNYNKYNKKQSKCKISGFEVARKILDDNGCKDIYVVETNGKLSDHYDPTRKTIRLSKEVFHGTSISSIAVASHEVGHVLQYKDNYTFIKIRNSIIPIVNFSSSASYILILISFFTGIMNLMYLGIALISIMLLFQLITLPVEYNASNRAKEQLKKKNILTSEELTGASKVLSAAALTYVASVLTAILEIIRLLLIAKDND